MPDVILSSPYARSRETARRFRDAGGAEADEPVCVDERLREKEFGILDGLTTAGVAAQLPQQAEFRQLLGKFYHRPPGGESWCDVILRLRSLLDTVSLHYGGRRVMIVAHQVVVLCLRYIIENLSEAEVLAIDRAGDVANCSVTEYCFDAGQGKDGGLALVRYNEIAPIEEDPTAQVTRAPDQIVAGTGMTSLDADWLASHPLPEVSPQTDKNARGQVLVAGGSMMVPGAILLTGEAALRAGAGKVQLATVDVAAMALGIAMPEAAVFGLPANAAGELAGEAGEKLCDLLDRTHCLVLGPGMGKDADGAAILDRLLSSDTGNTSFVIDAAAIAGARDRSDKVRARDGRLVLTPHPGEMVQLMGCDEQEIYDRPEAIVRAACDRFSAVVLLKRAETWIASPGEDVLRFEGGGPGLATAGSGDVLAGILGGLLARGAPPRTAAAWAVWLHGEAGQRCAARVGEIGFLARDLLSEVPGLMAGRRFSLAEE